jgi:hypothetical protein
MADDHEALAKLLSATNPKAAHAFQHYLYYDSEQTGREVAQALRERGLAVEDRLGADDVSWLVLVTCRVTPTEAAVEAMREAFEDIAEKTGGEYDGWEAAVEG